MQVSVCGNCSRVVSTQSETVSMASPWETLPEDEPPLCIAVRRPVSPSRHYEAVNRCGGLRNKGTPKSALNNIKGKNIQKKVEKELERLDKNIADMEIELDQVAKQSGEERTGLIEIKHMLADLEKRLVSSSVDNKDKNKETILEREQCINTVKELENTEESNQEANLTEEPEQDNKHERDAIMSDDDYLTWLVAENTMDEEEEMDEEIVATAETEISIPKERIETSTPKNEKRNKRRRMDSDCDSITNISTLEQDLRDLRYGLHYLPQRKIGETSSGDGGHHRALCNIPDSKKKIAARIDEVEGEIEEARQRQYQ
ncbi:hypothetical protein RB195_015664 [Necator americanus]|uniref:Uncharacterized protein n=1 Tax=Necator americanus TaxID=51031 RepID=A0ABR1E5K9_NECAM